MKNKGNRNGSTETLSVLALVALVLGLYFKNNIYYYVSCFMLFTGIFLKKIAEKISLVWTKISEFIGNVNAKIILTIIFYLLLTPIAFVYRVIHNDFMNIRWAGRGMDTAWTGRWHLYKAEDMEKIW